MIDWPQGGVRERERGRIKSEWREKVASGQKDVADAFFSFFLARCWTFARWLSRVTVGRMASHPHALVGVSDGRLRVVHGQHQARTPHHQLVVTVRQLPVQVVGGGGCASAAVDPRGVCADRDVAVGQVDVAVGQDEVRVVVLQLALILGSEERGRLLLWC